MAFNYQPVPQFPQQTQQPNSPQANFGAMNQNTFQQNVQPLFPQPQGNVYNINSTLEVANVPVGAGISVALCLNEGVMYVKSMQNGNPLFWAYKITPYDNAKQAEEKPSEEQSNTDIFESRFTSLEEEIQEIKNIIKSSKGEWNL